MAEAPVALAGGGEVGDANERGVGRGSWSEGGGRGQEGVCDDARRGGGGVYVVQTAPTVRETIGGVAPLGEEEEVVGVRRCDVAVEPIRKVGACQWRWRLGCTLLLPPAA